MVRAVRYARAVAARATLAPSSWITAGYLRQIDDIRGAGAWLSWLRRATGTNYSIVLHDGRHYRKIRGNVGPVCATIDEPMESSRPIANPGNLIIRMVLPWVLLE